MFYGRGLPGTTTSLECGLGVVVKREMGFFPEAESITGSRKLPPTETAEKRAGFKCEAQTHTGISETTKSRQSSGGNLEREG